MAGRTASALLNSEVYTKRWNRRISKSAWRVYSWKCSYSEFPNNSVYMLNELVGKSDRFVLMCFDIRKYHQISLCIRKHLEDQGLRCYNIKCIFVSTSTKREAMRMSKKDGLDDNYISIDEAALYLGIKTVTLRNWIKKNSDIPAHRVGKLWKFKRSELDDWVSSGKSAMD